MIVVASLIDKIPNLAGLARSCEIFQAEKLVLPSLTVVSNREFAGISMTAEKWLALEAVTEAQLMPWLQVRCTAPCMYVCMCITT